MNKRSEKLSEAVGELSDDIIERADSERQRLLSKRKLAIRRMAIGFGSAAACFVLAAGVFAAVAGTRGAIEPATTDEIRETIPTPAVTTITQAIDNGTTSPDGTLNDVITSGSFHTGTVNSETVTSPTGEDSEPPHTTVTEPTAAPPTTVTEKTTGICGVSTAPTTSATKESTKAPEKTTKTEKTTAPTTTIKHRDDIEINAEPLCNVVYPETIEKPEYEDYMPDGYDPDIYEVYRDKVKEYYQSINEKHELAKDISEYFDFYSSSAREILGSADGENIVYSPLAVYEALSMLAEITDGSTRDEVLSVLGSSDIETQRDRAQTLFVTNYTEDRKGNVIPAASLWVNSDYPYKNETIDSLAFNYFAESYLFDGYDSGSSARLQKWLNDKTRGLLEDSVDDVELTPETILNLCTTLYFNGKWYSEFNEMMTEEMTFHSPDGDIQTDFMYKKSDSSLYLGSNFTAVVHSFENNNGSMYFILPNEDAAVDDVLASDEYLDFVFNAQLGYEFDDYYAIVHERIPKFDIQSDIFLNDALENLGISEAFADDGDFSNLIPEDYQVSIGKVQHAARIKIDEEGCEAAAFVVEPAVGAGPYTPPPEEVYFTADRPFIIVLKSSTNQPLFMGVVNNP